MVYPFLKRTSTKSQNWSLTKYDPNSHLTSLIIWKCAGGQWPGPGGQCWGLPDHYVLLPTHRHQSSRGAGAGAPKKKKEKKNLIFLFHVYDSENNTGRLSKCDWEASLQKPSHWEIFYSLQRRGCHDGSARICRWARICMWQTEPDEVLEGITVNNSLKLWLGVDCKTNMHVCFLNMETITLCNGAASLGDLE